MKKGYITKIVLGIIISAGIMVYFLPLFTNNTTPGGDGLRIFPYIEFVNNSGSFYPLWDPYKLGGVPTLASPEKFTWLGNVINVNSKYANLSLNLIFVAVALLFAFSTYALARKVSISVYGAVIVALVFLCSQIIKSSLDCGRIYNCLELFLLLNVASLLYIKYIKRGNPWFFFLVSLILGSFVAIAGYYAIFMFFILFVFGYYANRQRQNPGYAFLKTSRQLLIAIFLGCLCMAVFIIPMAYYTGDLYTKIKPFKLLSQTLPHPGSLLNTFIPIDIESMNFVKEKIFAFVSLTSLPLLVILILNRRKLKAGMLPAFSVFTFASLVFLLGSFYPFKGIVLLLEKTPILWQLRHSFWFLYCFTFGLTFLSGFGYDAIKFHRPEARVNKIIPFIAVLALLLVGSVFIAEKAAGFLKAYLFDATPFSEALSSGFMSILKVLGIAGLLAVPYTALRNKNFIRVYIIFLLAVQFIFVKIDSSVAVTENRPLNREISDILNNDRSYYRIQAFTGISRPLGIPRIETFNEFALYFSNEHRWQLESLFKNKIEELRPHWVRMPRMDLWDENALELLNIKYVLNRPRFADPPLDKWRLVGEKETAKLWVKKDWQNSLMVFDKWEINPRVKDVLEEIRKSSHDIYGKVYVAKDPGIAPGVIEERHKQSVKIEKFDTENIVIEVMTNKNGVLFIPEYFDPGWKAEVDGMPSEVIRANASFRGVAVPKGRHTVKLYYAPLIIYIGAAISVITILSSITGTIWLNKRMRGINIQNG